MYPIAHHPSGAAFVGSELSLGARPQPAAAALSFDRNVPPEMAALCMTVCRAMGACFSNGFNRIHVSAHAQAQGTGMFGYTEIGQGTKLGRINLRIPGQANWQKSSKHRASVLLTFFHEILLHAKPGLERERQRRRHDDIPNSAEHISIYFPMSDNNAYLMGIKQLLPWLPVELREPVLQEYVRDVKTAITLDCHHPALRTEAIAWADKLEGFAENPGYQFWRA